MITQQPKVLTLVEASAYSSFETNLAKQEVIIGHFGVSNGWVRNGAVGNYKVLEGRRNWSRVRSSRDFSVTVGPS